MITYYQRQRHIFGDLKIADLRRRTARWSSTIPRSKHRGLNRVTWSMRLNPPNSSSGSPGCCSQPLRAARLPGNYTVKTDQGRQNSTPRQLKVVLDPRAKYNVEDRKAKYDLSLKLRSTISHMSFAVANIENVRDAATRDAAKLPQSDALRGQLQSLATRWTNFARRLSPLRKAA